jgi:glutaminyl-tRNA synthetase
LSKRKLLKLVEGKHVSGWDDPRLHTIDALRRRGFTKEAINAFVREIGVSTSNSTIEMNRLEGYVREHLNETADRRFVLEDPVRVTIENLPHGHIEEVEVPNKPRDDSRGTRMLPFARVIYIDAADFREDGDSNFYRLTMGQSVGLLHVPFPISCTRVIKDSRGKILELICRYENEGKFVKPKTYIQWVGQSGMQ